jgi:hypothetical protein
MNEIPKAEHGWEWTDKLCKAMLRIRVSGEVPTSAGENERRVLDDLGGAIGVVAVDGLTEQVGHGYAPQVACGSIKHHGRPDYPRRWGVLTADR